MNSSDSAEEIVKIYLDGVEVALKIAGAGAKEIGAILYAKMKDSKTTKGKTRLTNMLKTKETLKIFTIKVEDLKKFHQEAKRYGVLYCALADRKNKKIDGLVDIMVRETDASKINRIAERFNFAKVDTASIERELDKTKEQKNNEQEKSEDDKFIDDVLSKPEEKEEIKQEVAPSNNKETEEKNQSENSLNTKSKDKKANKEQKKKSVKEELKEIEKEVQARESAKELAPEKVFTKTKKEPKHLEEKAEKHKGKRYKEPKHLAPNSKKSKKRKSKERSK